MVAYHKCIHPYILYQPFCCFIPNPNLLAGITLWFCNMDIIKKSPKTSQVYFYLQSDTEKFPSLPLYLICFHLDCAPVADLWLFPPVVVFVDDLTDLRTAFFQNAAWHETVLQKIKKISTLVSLNDPKVYLILKYRMYLQGHVDFYNIKVRYFYLQFIFMLLFSETRWGLKMKEPVSPSTVL